MERTTQSVVLTIAFEAIQLVATFKWERKPEKPVSKVKAKSKQ